MSAGCGRYGIYSSVAQTVKKIKERLTGDELKEC
jgi:hypothetical protein